MQQGGNSSIVYIRFNGRKYYDTRTVIEEHCSVVKRPGSVYVDHLTPDGALCNDISDEFINCLVQTNKQPGNFDRHSAWQNPG